MLPLLLCGRLAPRLPVSMRVRPWQLVTYGFLHGGLSHLAFNMFGLYMFGNAVEQVLVADAFPVLPVAWCPPL
jgi:membrane associated rhomboid family serine protease